MGIIVVGLEGLLDIRDSAQMIDEALPYLRAFIPVLSLFVIGAAGTWLAISAWEGVAALHRKRSKRHRFIALSCSTSSLRRAVTELKDPMMRYLTMGQGLAIGDKLDMLASLATLFITPCATLGLHARRSNSTFLNPQTLTSSF